MMARYYSSSLGRFMAVDPGNDTQLENPQSWNKYAYVHNNPMNFSDPDGREASPQNRGDWLSLWHYRWSAVLANLHVSAATSETRRAFDIHPLGNIPDNSKANQVQHATMACRMARDGSIGEDIAATILLFHEWFDPISSDASKAFDLASNKVGFKLARDGDEDKTCIDLAREAQDEGRFPPVPATPDSPGAGANMCPRPPPDNVEGQIRGMRERFAGGPAIVRPSGGGDASNR